jgi:hypothetical protein
MFSSPPPSSFPFLDGTVEERWTVGESQILNQMGAPIFGKLSTKRLESDQLCDDAVTRDDPPGEQLHLGTQNQESEDEPYCLAGRLVNDGTGTGNMVWEGGSEEEETSDSNLSQDEYFLDGEEFDFDDLPSFYTPSAPVTFGLQLIASVFHEKRGYVAEWDLELELIRVIMETEPPEGNDYNDALNGGYSFWRWRGWIICLGAVKAYEVRGHSAAIALSRNMTTRDLPDSFTERPLPLPRSWAMRS